MATVELAVAIPALVLVLVVALSAVATVLDQVRCVDAARATARALARGDTPATAVGQARRLAPPAATVVVSGVASSGTAASAGTAGTAGVAGTVEVTVTAPAAPALRWLGPRASPSGHAVAAREDVPGGAG